MSNPSDQGKGRRSDAFKVDPDDFTIIGLDTNDGPEHPLYDRRVERFKTEGRAAVASLIESLAKEGQISDVSARINGDVKEVGCGKHRVFAMRFVKAEGLRKDFEVRTTYPRLTDDQWRDRIIAENLERRDSDAFTEAQAFADYVNARSLSDLAKLTKMKPRTLEPILALVQMPAPVRAIVTEHGIGRDVAVQAARLHTSQQEAFLRAYLAGDLQTPQRAKAMADEATARGTPKPTPTGPRIASRAELKRVYRAVTAGSLPGVRVPESAQQLLRALHGDEVEAPPPWLAAVLAAMGRATP